MTVRMTTLRRARNGDWLSRKAIPIDVRKAYEAAHGLSREERFRRDASMPVERAKQELREWEATICARINALRTGSNGEGQPLTQREAHGLAGEWYLWFVAQHEDEPGRVEGWDLEKERLDDAYARFAPWDADHTVADDGWTEAPRVRRHVRATLAEIARIPTFLLARNQTLRPEAHELFLDAVEAEYVAAIALLRRRAVGDFSEDKRPLRFPKVANHQRTSGSGLGCWGVFEAWVKERRPAPSTINRWRSVFLALEERFKARDAASITNDEAIEWKTSLVTAERSPLVANDIWLTAARTVFAWALSNKLVGTNPFEGVSIAQPAKAQELREREFSESEWQTILRASLAPPPPRMASHNAVARRWVPWLCAYTGSRPGEVTQLRAQDIHNNSGLWVLRITPEAGAVKGRRARVVPIHEHLVEQGFVEFANAQRNGPLFYEANVRHGETLDLLKPVRPPWVKAREKLAEWVRSLGVTDPNISPNHAWRHTFKRRAARAGIERHVRDAICGHKLRDVSDKYEAPTVEDMATALKAFPRYTLIPKVRDVNAPQTH